MLMRKTITLLFLFFLAKSYFSLTFSQTENIEYDINSVHGDSVSFKNSVINDSTFYSEIKLSHNQAIDLLLKIQRYQFWKKMNDTVRSAMNRLVFEASNPPFDLIDSYLKRLQFDTGILSRDTLKLDSASLRDRTSLYPGYNYPYSGDSLKAAVTVLLNYIEGRDSSLIRFKGTGKKEYSFWLNSRFDRVVRFWLSNDLNDSVTVWISNPERNSVGLYLEHGVTFRRPTKQGNITKAKINIEPQDKSTLIDAQKIITKPQFWKYRTEASFLLSQGYLSNWVKGGQSSVSTLLDITWFADYINKPLLISSNHFARLKYGLVASGADGIRKNLDLLETNSKFNHKAFGKFDFSAIMLFKTQISKGYNYPNDSVPVSRFMNPAIITIGFGLDYKPNKQTSINFSPLSYKATFVPDTALIDQTKYGIPANKRSKHEPGVSFMISNEFRPLKNLTITNRFQLFTNYISKPQNIDVDWEMILQTNLNWFTDVRLNTHLIFDDDTKTPVLDKDKNPVLGNDGLPKKTARIQFKELLGLSFVFRF